MILPANAATRKETLVFTGMRTSIVLSRLNVFERNYKRFRHKLVQEGKYASGLLPFKEKKRTERYLMATYKSQINVEVRFAKFTKMCV